MLFIVIDKVSGLEISRYSAMSVVYDRYPEALFTHEAISETTQASQSVGGLVSKLDFISRFTDLELERIFTLAKTVPAVEVWVEKFKLAEFIDTSDTRNLTGLTALEVAGVLEVGRAMEIYNG